MANFYTKNIKKIFGFPPYLYFITDGVFIKIGTTEKLSSRFQSLQTGNPKKLELIGAVTGSRNDEKNQHYIWEKYRTNGEWFSITRMSAENEIKKLSYKIPILGYKNLLDEYLSMSRDVIESRYEKICIEKLSRMIHSYSKFLFDKSEIKYMAEECGIIFDDEFIYGLELFNYDLPQRFCSESPYKMSIRDFIPDWDL